MLAFLNGSITERNMSYSFHSYGHGRLVAEDLLIMDSARNVLFSTFSMTRHLLYFCQEVCAKPLGEKIYTTVYYMSPGGAKLLFARQLDNSGWVFLFLDGEAWSRTLDRLPCDFVITDGSGTVFTTNNSALVDSLNRFRGQGQSSLSHNGQRYLVSCSEHPGDILIYTLMTGRAWKAYYGIGCLCLLLMFLITLLSLLQASRKIASRNSRSLEMLHSAFSIIQDGDIEYRIQLDSGDEFQEIADHINSMMADINELNRKNIELAQLNSNAQIAELEARFHPHFIYNTLENIRFAVLMKEPQRADEMLRLLTALLRYSSDSSRQMVPLGEDMEKLRDYLEIMRFRHEGCFSYRMEIEDTVRDILVPKLLIQPVVENSIKYGYRRKSSLQVVVRAGIEGEELCITVWDDGAGIEPDRLTQLRQDLDAPQPDQRISGLMSISRRIRLMYGEGSGISVDSRYPEETCVTLRMKRSERHVQGADRRG